MREEHAAMDHASDGVMPLLFAMLCFAIAAYSFFVVFVAVHIWLVATILLRLCEGKYVRAALWSFILAWLVNLDAIWLR
jgi:hypothetical protein